MTSSKLAFVAAGRKFYHLLLHTEGPISLFEYTLSPDHTANNPASKHHIDVRALPAIYQVPYSDFDFSGPKRERKRRWKAWRLERIAAHKATFEAALSGGFDVEAHAAMCFDRHFPPRKGPTTCVSIYCLRIDSV